ncbi:hypothetical protein V6N12_023578 [Hibiscus sabdariffa]|uniref:Uncharacterized protein n=1 Tax=Hibiscus sabdariffa TaxID=183260 RepID=A0ABR2FY38_9ROSI
MKKIAGLLLRPKIPLGGGFSIIRVMETKISKSWLKEGNSSIIRVMFFGLVPPLGADYVELAGILVALDLFVEVDLLGKSILYIESNLLLVNS